jgi:S1-C subfamily serine protease
MKKLKKLGKENSIFIGSISWMMTLVLFLFSGCTVSRIPQEDERLLVEKEAPVFDRRFEKLGIDEIDPKRMWVQRDKSASREPVAVNNYTIADLVDKTKNGVVNIYTLKIEEREARFGIHPNDLLPIRIPLISSILEIIPFQVPIPFRTKGVSLGSGFIINDQGYILTNAHVIYNATDIRVVLSERRKEFPARIIGMDTLTDTALIKIETRENLTVIPLGDSDNLRVGEMVVAMGNPMGLRHSVSSGIVSATERVAPQLNDQFLDFVQTDSAINPGSSGGPMINMHGEVVGMNTAILAKAQAIGFAIPINTAKEVMPLLLLGRTQRGWLGIKAMPLTDQIAAALNYPDEHGIVIIDVQKGSPAEKAGIKMKDVISGLGGAPLESFHLFRRKLLGLIPGQEIQLTIWREGQHLELTAVLESREEE